MVTLTIASSPTTMKSPKKPTTAEDGHRLSMYLVLMSLGAGVAGNFQFGYLASVLTQPYIAIEQYIEVSWTNRTGATPSRQTLHMLMSALNVANPIAAIFGQMMAMWLCERFGRKGAALIGCAINFPGIGLSLAAKWLQPAFELLFIGRIIWSFSVGMLVVNQTIWLVEAAPARYRGSVSSMQEVFAALGGLATQAFGVPFSTDDLWPMMFVFPLLVNVLCMLIFVCVPESPSYLLFRRKAPKMAKRAIAAYHGLTDAKEIEQQFVAISQSGTAAGSDKVIESPKAGGMDIMFRPWRTPDPVSRVIRRGAWIGIMVKIAYLFTGTRCIRSFNTFVLHDLGGWNYLQSRYGSLAIGLLRIPFTLLPVFIVDRVGRRPLLIGSAGSSVVFLTVIMFCVLQGEAFKLGTLLGVTALLTVNSVGLGSLARFYAAELVPRKLLLKSVSALAILEALFRIGLEFSFYPIAFAIGGYYFLTFLLPTAIFFVFIWRCCPETSGRNVNDVLNDMARQKGVDVTFQV